MSLPKASQRFTYADYLSWPEGDRWELIDGMPYAMGPAPTRRHQQLAGGIFHQLMTALRGKPCEPYIAPFDVHLVEESADTVVQPDIVVVCDPGKLTDQGCEGAPDWIVEVLSPGTALYDQTLKKALYERAGVREFWLVDPRALTVTIYGLDGGLYGPGRVQALQGITAARALPGVVIDWDALA